MRTGGRRQGALRQPNYKIWGRKAKGLRYVVIGDTFPVQDWALFPVDTVQVIVANLLVCSLLESSLACKANSMMLFLVAKATDQ
jgi:hypothetical protein